MPCFNPLHAFPYPSDSSRAGQYYVYSNFIDKPDIIDPETGEVYSQINIPCGKCIGCRMDYSKEWATRIMLEALRSKENYFITLTYDDFHVHKNEDGALTLFKPDLSAFMKRFRSRLEYLTGETGVRFFGCGEYGEKTFRPHFHICVFNAPLSSTLRLEGKNKLGQALFSSDIVDDSWSFGHTAIGELSWNTAAYTARYTLKKAGGKDNHFYEKLGVEPEFVNMSRRPGIGAYFFDDNYTKIYQDGRIILPAISKDKPNIQSIPKYFDKKMSDLDPLTLSKVKVQRQLVAQIAHDAKLQAIQLDEYEYFELEEKRCSERLKKLHRDL